MKDANRSNDVSEDAELANDMRSVIVAPEPAPPDGFTDEEHELGLKLQREVPNTLAHVFAVGKMLDAAHQSLCGPGRSSTFGDWCEYYLPSIDRKTLDRWRLAYANFQPLLADDGAEGGHACLPSENIRLTAIYRLSASDATDADRKTAIDAARNGKVVDVKFANLLVGKRLSPTTTKTFRKNIELPAGKVTLSLNHDDWAQALSEALREIKDP